MGFTHLGDEAALVNTIQSKKVNINDKFKFHLSESRELSFNHPYQGTGSRHHQSCLCTHSAFLSPTTSPIKPTPVAVIQPANGLFQFNSPKSWRTEPSRFPFLPALSGRFQIALRAPSRLGCIHLRNAWVLAILYWPHHQHIYRILQASVMIRNEAAVMVTQGIQ
jgi:hypothetical protein